MSEFKTVRGMRDFLPEEARIMRYVESQARDVARLYGFGEIITPIVESYELLAAKSGEEVRSRMFAFKDLGDRNVTLRPEFTASVARLVASTLRNEPRPFRLFSIGSVYRYDEPQKGRYREFWQSNYELMGSSKPEADAEIILLTNSLMERAGLKNWAFKVGHVGVLRSILSQENLSEQKQNEVMQLLDHKQYDDALEVVRDNGASEKCTEVFRKLVELRGNQPSEVIDRIREYVKDFEKALTVVENLKDILHLVVESGCKTDIMVDAGFARGLEYYTGMVFEVDVPELNVALGGGGRYDKLIELFGGESTPAVGVAHGIDRIMLALQEQKAVQRVMVGEKKTLVISTSEKLRADALKITQKLRSEGVAAELEVVGRKMAKALEYGDRRNFDYAVIVGEQELQEDAVVLRDMKTRKQSTVETGVLADVIRRSIG